MPFKRAIADDDDTAIIQEYYRGLTNVISMRAEGEWQQDTVFFDATIRKSGNSLVITIPPELARRFLIAEGHRVTLVGAVRKGAEVEGSIYVYLGRFLVSEKVQGIRFRIKGVEELPDFVHTIMARYSPTRTVTKPRGDGLECRFYMGSLTPQGIRPRSGREIRRALEEVKEEAERQGYEVMEEGIFEEEVSGTGIDPAVVSRGLPLLEGKISYEWAF